MNLKLVTLLATSLVCRELTPTYAQPAPPPQNLQLGDAGFRVGITVNPAHLLEEFGPRFDATAMVSGVSVDGRSFLTPNGLTDEFGIDGIGVLGFEDAKTGGSFLKIGVGKATKADHEEYRFWHKYAPQELAPVKVTHEGNTLTLRQSARLNVRYGYEYRKRYRVLPDTRELVIEYSLRNTGYRPFSFSQYNHNWFAFEGHATAPPLYVETGFPIVPVRAENWLNIEKTPTTTKLRLSKPILQGAPFDSLASAPAKQNYLTLHSPNSGQQIQVGGDFAVKRFALFVDENAICPEVFLQESLQPGDARSWKRSYRFINQTPLAP